MCGDGKVGLINVLTLSCFYDHVRGDHLGEVVHYDLCVDFLFDARHLF